ncbi:MAG: hypothetical protein ACLSWI_00160 [Candidatus Gastranaerophilaceae bacterium]
MSLPVLIQKIEDRQNIAAWKKKYAEIASIYSMVKEEMGSVICVDEKNGNYSVPKKCQKVYDYEYGVYTTLSPEFVNKFVSHLKVIDSCGFPQYGESKYCSSYYKKWVALCGGAASYSFYGSLKKSAGNAPNTPTACTGAVGPGWDYDKKAVLLADGSVIYLGGYATGWIAVDVNSFKKGPNVLGRDFFAATVNDDWIKPLGADETFNKSNNGEQCECSKDYGLESAQGFLGSGNLLNGRMISGGCCSAVYLSK